MAECGVPETVLERGGELTPIVPLFLALNTALDGEANMIVATIPPAYMEQFCILQTRLRVQLVMLGATSRDTRVHSQKQVCKESEYAHLLSAQLCS